MTIHIVTYLKLPNTGAQNDRIELMEKRKIYTDRESKIKIKNLVVVSVTVAN